VETTYVGDRSVLDADSHVMELTDFLDDFVDPEFKDRLRDVTSDRLAGVLTDAIAKSEARHSDTEVAKLAEERLLRDKGWHAMGAFDPVERSRVLDLLGVEGQLVFATFATARFAGKDEDRLYAGSSAQNRAMANFCSQDERLLPVAFVPLVDPGRSIALAVEAVESGCAAVMVPSTAAGARSPTHPDLDGFWDLLSDANVPFVLHVGGGGRLLDPAFHNNAMPVPDHLGGGENVRSKDFLAIPHSPEVFLGALIYDGLFDRFPKLRGGCIEQGAGWVV
jgi:predicted TIM-barrel fold metal-dependent hydrolase